MFELNQQCLIEVVDQADHTLYPALL